mgnify:CR=1 FL=1
MQFKSLAVTSDHADLQFKEKIIEYLRTKGLEVLDLGPPVTYSGSVDYPDYAAKLTKKIVEKKTWGGIAICGTGIGMSIASNKFPGIRAACPWNKATAEMTRKHNNSNVLCLGARTLSLDEAISLLNIWLKTPFDGGRHEKRLDKIAAFDRKSHS